MSLVEWIRIYPAEIFIGGIGLIVSMFLMLKVLLRCTHQWKEVVIKKDGAFVKDHRCLKCERLSSDLFSTQG